MTPTPEQLGLQSGDLIFTSINNFLYRQVARTTRSRTSHVGIIFRDEQQGWLVAESAVPRSRFTTLNKFIARSDHGWYVIRRHRGGLSASQAERLRQLCRERCGQWYHLGFNYDSRLTYCSKYAHDAYRDALGLEVGQFETFGELLQNNPAAPVWFWRIWFFGSVPWERKTITPASLMNSPELVTVATSDG